MVRDGEGGGDVIEYNQMFIQNVLCRGVTCFRGECMDG